MKKYRISFWQKDGNSDLMKWPDKCVIDVNQYQLFAHDINAGHRWPAENNQIVTALLQAFNNMESEIYKYDLTCIDNNLRNKLLLI